MRFEGTYTALVTPFRDEPGHPVDWDAFDALIDAQVAGGIAGVVPCGTTGESPALSHEEHALVVERVVKRAKGRVQVIAGTGSNSTREAVEMSQHAERAGADAVMLVVPYYNRPSPEGLVRHFTEVAKSVRVPVVLYNIPGRTAVDLPFEALQKIAEAVPNVVAVKEATGNVLRAQKIVQVLGDRLTVLSGDDALTLAMIAVGARGVISVTSNVLPAEVTAATRLALDGASTARRAHLRLMPAHEAMFLEPSPGPVKAALAMRGAIRDVVRLPMTRCTEGGRAAVAAALDAVQRGGLMRLAVVGASGRMGRAIVRLAHSDGIALVCAVGAGDVGRDAGELAGVGPIGTPVVDDVAALGAARADVVIDFSVPPATLALAPIAAAAGSAIVSGTTGLDERARQALDLAAHRVPVFWEPNTSAGVHVLSELVARAAAALADWDVEIVEVHHRGKVDAPSGTALRLAESARDARPAASHLVHGRQGRPGPRAGDEIGMHALRGGDVVGEHMVYVTGDGERLELVHRATNRDVFARGALRAARWIAGKPPGRYGMRDVLAAVKI